MTITIMTDIVDSFFLDYKNELIKKIKKKGYEVKFINDRKKITNGKILFCISCKSILNDKELKKNLYNVVVHPSKLPKGRGSAAVANEILNNRNKIYISLFEATNKLDTGDIYLQDFFNLSGLELNDEIRKKQANLTNKMVLKFLDLLKTKKIKKKKQKIITNKFLKKRYPEDSQLNINKSIKSQLNLLRVCDNKRYPAFFHYKKKKFLIKIYDINDK